MRDNGQNVKKEDLNTLSEWMKSSRVWSRWYKLELLKPYVAKHLSLLHDTYVNVFVDKAPINIVFVCKSHYNTLRN